MRVGLPMGSPKPDDPDNQMECKLSVAMTHEGGTRIEVAPERSLFLLVAHWGF